MKIKMNMKKDEIYIINQPKHVIMSVVLVDCKLPLDEKIHEKIYELEEISDVLFVFSDLSKNINPKKFTSLYEACGWIETSGNIGRTVIKSLIYGKEVFEKHMGYCVTSLELLKDLDSNFKDKLQNLNMDPINSPVFKLRRLNSQEYYDIYNEPKTCFLCKNKNIDNMFCSYTTDSKIMFFRAKTLSILFNFMNSNKEIIDSFKKTDPRFLLASLVKFLGIELVDKNLEE